MAIVIVSCKLSFSFYYFLLLLIISIVSQAKAQPNFLDNSCVNDNGNYTANSTYQNNLNILLSNLTSNTKINYGFYNFSYGQNNDKVNAIGFCRGDVKPDVCRNCLNDSRVLLTRLCPNQKEAIGWYDNCMLRYSNRSIFGIMEQFPWSYIASRDIETEVNQYNRALGNLMKKLKEKAASSNDSRVKYATGNETDVNLNFETIYGLVQCTPDLSSQDCMDCLNGAISEIPFCCSKMYSVRVVEPSCNIRYESYPFYGPSLVVGPPPLVVDPDETSRPQEKSKSSHTAIAIVVPTIVAVAVLLTLIICICLRRNRHSMAESNLEGEEEMMIAESLQFNFDIIRVATSDFSDSNKLGQGGFGIVYWGQLPNGQMIAVKRLSTNSGQGDLEFKNEVLLVAKLQHRNLVRLLGFSLERRERLLIYEFVPNKSLDYFIFDLTRKTQLNWEKRSNIIKDDEMNPKISDFGLARLFDIGQTHGSTNRIVGTYGYMAPEYVMLGEFSVKSDVFSFGVLVLETISGHKNSANICHGEDVEYLLTYAWRSWREGKAINIIDPSLSSNISKDEIMRCIHIGLLCVQENVVDRPTMASVALMLNSNSLTLSIPSKPAYFMGSASRTLPDMQQQVDNLSATRSNESVNQISITDLYPR
ncbi:putative receptor protein kinase [Trifolium repens]|nr:putative receptor protein kinase [Trifolium repens]